MINDKIKRIFTISFVSLCFLGYVMPIDAQTNQSNNIQIRYKAKEADGSSRGRPSRRVGTGSRGECPPPEVPITALIPPKIWL